MPLSDLTHTFLVVTLIVALMSCDPVAQGELHVRHKRQTVADRPGCQSGAQAPPTRVNTTARIAALRNRFSNATGGPIHAYIVPSEDAHQSAYPADYDLRRGYISGFIGSAGTAVILTTEAALWTDGRYFLEAEDFLDCNWILMKQGVAGVPSISDWLVSKLQYTSNAVVGANPFLMNARTWKIYQETFSKAGITMVQIEPDFVDDIWTTNRPARPDTTINELPLTFSGKSWQDKIGDVRAQFEAKGATAYVVTSLDETAWLFNLRASDINYNPFFISYAIVESHRVSLYLFNHTIKLTQNSTDVASTKKLYEHLNTGQNGSCAGITGMCVEVLRYDGETVKSTVAAIASASDTNKVWISYQCNQAIHGVIPENQTIHDKSAIALMKSKKNEVERNGMYQSHIRDMVALITFMEKLEREVKAGKYWSEVTAAADLKQHRLNQEHNRGLSFGSISAVGANGAIIHYSPTNATDKQITTSELYLLDSGGQYLDGTTDVTRTFHFGTPTSYEKECYTRVLMGHIDLALLKWPKGLLGGQIDAVTRAPLWKVGLRYLHGTGHGIGAYLSVHEGPGSIGLYLSSNPTIEALEEHMYFSDEPGYYEDGKFGIRLETIVTIEIAETKYQFPNSVFLGFKAVALMPYEPNLIDFNLLSSKQKQWLVDYHRRVTNEVVPKLSAAAKQWVEARTDQFTTLILSSGSTRPVTPTVLMSFIAGIILMILSP